MDVFQKHKPLFPFILALAAWDLEVLKLRSSSTVTCQLPAEHTPSIDPGVSGGGRQ